MPFISLLLKRYRFSIGERRATHLKGAGELLTSLDNYFPTMGARPDSRHIREAYAFYKQFVQFRKLAELPLRPKCISLLIKCLGRPCSGRRKCTPPSRTKASMPCSFCWACSSSIIWEYHTFQFFVHNQNVASIRKRRHSDVVLAKTSGR
jgi:hypothetical protein